MEKHDEEKFDGQVVLVANGDLNKSDARYYHRGFTVVEAFKTLNRAKELLKIQQMGLSPKLANGIFPDLATKIEALKKEHGEEIVNILLNGRLKVSALLNSPEGPIISADRRKELFKMIQRREDAEGKVDAYLKYAAGGAAEIFLQADDRIITPESLICPTFYTNGDPEFNEERNFYLSLSMTAKAPDNVREELKERINEVLESKDGANAMLFDAQEMMRFGLATRIVDSTESLKEEFMKRTGITLLPDKLSGEFEQEINVFFR